MSSDDWQHDDTLIPGWRVAWKMGWTKQHAFVVSDLQITRVPPAPPRRPRGMSDQDWLRMEISAHWAGRIVPGAGLTARMVASIQLGRLGDETRTRAFPGIPGAGSIRRTDPNVIVRRRSARAAKAPRAGRPPTRTTDWYRQVARRHGELTRARVENPSQQLAEEFGLSRTAMRTVIHRLRQPAPKGWGLLPPTVPGVARPRRARL